MKLSIIDYRLRKPALAGAASSLLLLPDRLLAACTGTAQEGAAAVGAACGDTALKARVGAVIDTFFLVIGTIAVIILLVGAIRYITSTGDATRIKQAKDTILYAILGLIIAILARAIVGFVIGRLGS